MNVEKAMIARPARWPLDTLDACIRDFLWRRAPGGGMDVGADDIPAMCAEAPDFDDAVWIAVASKRRNGKMHSHQSKVTLDARRQFGYRIIVEFNEEGELSTPGTFDEFYDKLWEIRPPGIGPLTNYDVATRIGAYLELEPKQIYLHTGARQGWDAMWGPSQTWLQGRSPGRVDRSMWPVALLQLKADMAEDFLCTYRSVLSEIKRSEFGYPL